MENIREKEMILNGSMLITCLKLSLRAVVAMLVEIGKQVFLYIPLMLILPK